MRLPYFLTVSFLGAASALPLASAARANIVIDINKSTQSMTVAVDGATRYQWPVSTGRAGYDTPSGTFKPNRMDPTHFSKEYENAPMPHSIFFDMHGHAIHGFFDTPHLGMAVSHGCVRLSPANAATLFSLVKAEGMANTTVEIGGHIPAGGQYMARRGGYQTAEQPMPIAPGYGQQGYYGQQPYYGRQAYGQSYYAQPYYGQQQQYYARPAYGQPGYQQW
jgi:hypothetical protein